MHKFILLLLALSLSNLSTSEAVSRGTYDVKIQKYLKDLPSKIAEAQPTKDSFVLEVLDPLDRALHCALRQKMWIKAPLQRVVSVIDDIAHYQNLYFDFNEVRLVNRNGNRFSIYWEQESGIFFVANTWYQLIYDIFQETPERKIYTYSLHDSNRLEFLDGVFIAEADGTGSTYFWGFDSYSLQAGFGNSFVSEEKLLTEGIKGTFTVNYALKMKAENPGLGYEKIRKMTEKGFREFGVEELMRKPKQQW